MKKYILKYVLAIVIFSWGFAFAEEIFIYREINWHYLGTSLIDMIEGNSWNHMWYLYELVGIMLVLPIARVIVRALNEKEQSYLGIVFFVFLSVFPILSHLFNVQIGIRFPISSICFFTF